MNMIKKAGALILISTLLVLCAGCKKQPADVPTERVRAVGEIHTELQLKAMSDKYERITKYADGKD